MALGRQIDDNGMDGFVTLDEQLIMNIRMKTLRNYDEIINSVDKLKEGIIFKDIEISGLHDDFRAIKAEKEEKNGVIQLFREHLSTELDATTNFYDDQKEFDVSENNEELNDGKLLIAELINQLDEGSGNVEIENYRLSDLIHIFSRSIINKEEQLDILNKNFIENIEDENRQLIKEIDDQKEWQKHLENENEKLISKIENLQRVQTVLMSKENENNDIKENYLKLQCMYDDLRDENAHLKTLVNRYKRQLTEKITKCVDSDTLIKTLESNLSEQTKNYEQANSMYNTEKEKCQEIQQHTQQIIDEFTTRIHEKQIDICAVRDECCTLKDQIGSAEAEIDNLKHVIVTLEYALNEKNIIVQDLLKKTNKQQNTIKTSSAVHLNSDPRALSKLLEQMTAMQNNLCVCKDQLLNYESVLCSMHDAIEQQSIKATTAENEKKKLTESIDQNNVILLGHLREEIDCLKSKHNLQIENLTGMTILMLIYYLLFIRRSFYFADAKVSLRNEIRSLENNIKLKSSQIIVVEKIASSQLGEAFNTIERLRQENQVCNRSTPSPIV